MSRELVIVGCRQSRPTILAVAVRSLGHHCLDAAGAGSRPGLALEERARRGVLAVRAPGPPLQGVDGGGPKVASRCRHVVTQMLGKR